MIAQVKIFNEQQLLGMAACIWLRADRKIYDEDGILVRTVPDYDKRKIKYKPEQGYAFVYCESERVFKQLLKSGFMAKEVPHEEYLAMLEKDK